jgi:hypothetical protein
VQHATVAHELRDLYCSEGPYLRLQPEDSRESLEELELIEQPLLVDIVDEFIDEITMPLDDVPEVGAV